MVRSKAWIGLYIVIVEVGRAYEHASGESEWLPFVIFPWIGVVVTTVFFPFPIANSYSTILIFFFKSSIREFEDEKVWVTTSAIFC